MAEQLVFGSSQVTTGAGGDLQQVERMARAMVTQFGMSDARYNREVFKGVIGIQMNSLRLGPCSCVNQIYNIYEAPKNED